MKKNWGINWNVEKDDRGFVLKTGQYVYVGKFSTIAKGVVFFHSGRWHLSVTDNSANEFRKNNFKSQYSALVNAEFKIKEIAISKGLLVLKKE
jgi:hypothetical protein